MDVHGILYIYIDSDFRKQVAGFEQKNIKFQIKSWLNEGIKWNFRIKSGLIEQVRNQLFKLSIFIKNGSGSEPCCTYMYLTTPLRWNYFHMVLINFVWLSYYNDVHAIDCPTLILHSLVKDVRDDVGGSQAIGIKGILVKTGILSFLFLKP
jgi:hypothetical protein